jgi:phage/plasmid-associated DNA primase
MTAFWQLVRKVKFPNKFLDQDATLNLADKLAMPQELRGLLNKTLDALKQIPKQKGFTGDKTKQEVRDDYLKPSDTAEYFIERTVETTRAIAGAGKLRTAIKSFFEVL